MNQAKPIQKYESEVGMMKESGVGKYVKLSDYRALEGENYGIRCEKQNDLNKIAELEFNENQTHAKIKHLQAALAKIAELETSAIHTCHAECPRIVCVQGRKIAELEAANADCISLNLHESRMKNYESKIEELEAKLAESKNQIVLEKMSDLLVYYQGVMQRHLEDSIPREDVKALVETLESIAVKHIEPDFAMFPHAHLVGMATEDLNIAREALENFKQKHGDL